MDVDLDAIAKGMALAVPYIGHMGIEVTELSEGEATALLPDRPELHNHVGSQHAGALFGVAETASGAAFVGAFAGADGRRDAARAERRDRLRQGRARADRGEGAARC